MLSFLAPEHLISTFGLLGILPSCSPSPAC